MNLPKVAVLTNALTGWQKTSTLEHEAQASDVLAHRPTQRAVKNMLSKLEFAAART